MQKLAVPTLTLLALLGCRQTPTGSASARPQQPSSLQTAAANAETHPGAGTPTGTRIVPTDGYADAEHGVSFRYPTVWTASHSQEGYLPSAILDTPGVHGKQTVTFSPLGNIYQATNLSNLNFTYALLRNATAQTCHDAVAKNQDRTSPPTTVIVAGVPFTEVSGGDAGMSHRLAITLDGTFRSGTCYLFERDEATVAPGVQPGHRTLTATEEAALQRHLRDIFESVRFQ